MDTHSDLRAAWLRADAAFLAAEACLAALPVGTSREVVASAAGELGACARAADDAAERLAIDEGVES